jgi:AcrR family transcriptional regulator
MTTGITKRQQQAKATKTALFDSAIKLFKEKGYDQVTVEDITTLAGTAKGSFYTYFRTKSDIIIEEFRTIDDYYQQFARNLRRYEAGRDKVLAFTRAQMRYVRDKVGIETLKLLYANNIMEPTTEKVLIDTSRYLHRLVRDLITEGQETGHFRTDVEADELALLFNRSFRSIFLDWAIANAGFDLIKEGMRFCEVVVLPALEPR